MTIHNHNLSNREPNQYRKPYTSYTYRTCPDCGHEIASPEGQEWACSICEIIADQQAKLDEAKKAVQKYDEQVAETKPAADWMDGHLGVKIEDPRIARRESILAAFRDEPLMQGEATELYEELAEIDQSLQINPSDTLQARMVAQFPRMDEISF